MKAHPKIYNCLLAISLIIFFVPFPVSSNERLQRLLERKRIQETNRTESVSVEASWTPGENSVKDAFDDREILLYIPSNLPAIGQRAMIVALHGGMGNARFLQNQLKLDGVAERYGFIVAYLNGSAAAPRLPDSFRAWNAGGGCCGKPYADKIDDIRYIAGAIQYLENKYGIDPKRVFGIGHSNGAMMTQTLMCQTNLYPKAVSLAGALMADAAHCVEAHSKEILAIHGRYDQNVPPGGGVGTHGVTNIPFRSELDSQKKFQDSGGRYTILWVESDHSLENIAAAVQKREGISLADEVARFFELAYTAKN